jgi:hypothetical protein
VTRIWVLGLIVAACVAAMVVVLRHRLGKLAVKEVDLPLWDAQQHLQSDEWTIEDQNVDTTPAVLAPAEWSPQKLPNDQTR